MLVTALLVSASLAASPWKKVDEEDGMTLEARSVDETTFEELRITTLVPRAPPEWLCDAILAEVGAGKPHSTDIVRKVVRQRSDAVVVYDHVEAPLVSRRDYGLEFKKVLDGQGGCRMEWAPTTEDIPPLAKGTIRMPIVRGSFTFLQVSDTSTLLTYTSLADPGGSIPAWIARGGSRKGCLTDVRGYLASFKTYTLKHPPSAAAP